MHLPSLSDVKLWKKSGRFDQLTGEVFTLKDKLGTELLLAPTHEEVVTQLVAKRQLMTTNQFPLRLYQSSYKFRDEMNPRFGLLRAKEFLMTDLYIFDTTKEAAALSYEKITKAYEVLFNQLLRLVPNNSKKKR